MNIEMHWEDMVMHKRRYTSPPRLSEIDHVCSPPGSGSCIFEEASAKGIFVS